MLIIKVLLTIVLSHLSFLSKLTERMVKYRLVNHLHDNNLLNSFQTAYVKSHSAETTLLAVHDYIRAMSLQQITCLCLLDLSTAFDTVAHPIFLEHIRSWFDFSNTVLSWIKSHFTHRSFCVNLHGTISLDFSYSMVYLRGQSWDHFFSF
jgi:hypothetical protein